MEVRPVENRECDKNLIFFKSVYMAASGLGNLRKITLDDLNKLLHSGEEQIVDCEIIEDAWITNANVKNVCFVNCKFTKLFILKKLVNLTIQNCDFHKVKISSDVEDIKIVDIESNESCVAIEKIYIGTLQISNCKKIDRIILSLSEVNEAGQLNIQDANIRILGITGNAKAINIYDNCQIERLSFNGSFRKIKIFSPFDYLEESDCDNRINRISYKNNCQDGLLQLFDVTTNTINLFGAGVDVNIELTNVKCQKLILSDNLGKVGIVKISNCNDLSEINFNSAICFCLEIFNTDLSNSKFITGQSFIENIRWQFVNWPEKLEQYNDPNHNEFQKGETLRNLKLNAHNQQDVISYVKFYSLEMQAYQQQIETKKWYSEDRMLLWLNRISNKHGLSWKRGVLFSFAVGALFFFPNLFLLENSYWEFGWNGWFDFWTVCSTTLKLFSQSLYAAHSFDYLNEFKPNGIALLIDFIGRIFLAYGYYQTIVAFRKFSRK